MAATTVVVNRPATWALRTFGNAETVLIAVLKNKPPCAATRLTTRPSTYRRYAQIVEQYLVPAIGRIHLERLTPSDVRAMLNAKATKLRSRSLHHIRTVLRTALKVAMRDGLIPNNAAALAESPRVPATGMRTLGEDDVGHPILSAMMIAFIGAVIGECQAYEVAHAVSWCRRGDSNSGPSV
jgi:Phage integrase, N-terminal SAM-like domain